MQEKNRTTAASNRPRSSRFDEDWYSLELEKLKEEWERAYYERKFDLPFEVFGSSSTPLNIVKLALSITNDFVRKLDNACRDIGSACGAQITPEFIRHNVEERVIEAADNRADLVRRDLGFLPQSQIEGALAYLVEQMDKLKDDMRRDYAIEIRKVQHGATSSNSPASALSVTASPSNPDLSNLPSKQADLSSYFDNLTDIQRNCASLKWEYGLADTEIARRMGGRHHSTIQENLDAAKKRMDMARNIETGKRRRAVTGPLGQK